MDEVFGGEVHAQRLASLTDGVDGVLHAASLGGRALGQGLAVAQGLAPRHAIKQVDRLLSNPKLSMAQVFGRWVLFVGERRAIFVNCDWTECADADQCTVVLGRQTAHGQGRYSRSCAALPPLRLDASRRLGGTVPALYLTFQWSGRATQPAFSPCACRWRVARHTPGAFGFQNTVQVETTHNEGQTHE